MPKLLVNVLRVMVIWMRGDGRNVLAIHILVRLFGPIDSIAEADEAVVIHQGGGRLGVRQGAGATGSLVLLQLR